MVADTPTDITSEDIASTSTQETQGSNQESPEVEYIPLNVAMKMADRSSKTIRNWLKEGLIQGRKENPENAKSKWLIHRASLMTHLAIAVEAEPPRRSNEQQIDSTSPLLQASDTSQHTTEASKEEHEALREELKQTQSEREQFRLAILELEKRLAIAESKIEMKDEIIEHLKASQPSIEAFINTHERKVLELQEQLTDTEKQLSIVRFAYEQEAQKGFFARLLTSTPALKMLEVLD